jgi:MerR family transcriptional regulator, copper efflux regulator
MGDVTELFGLTARTVRFYDERGLVTPTRDHCNRRQFDAQAREALRLIAQLRRAGLSVAEIRTVLEGRENGQAEAVPAMACGRIEMRRNDLKRQLADVAQVAAWLVGQFLARPAASSRQTASQTAPRI